MGSDTAKVKTMALAEEAGQSAACRVVPLTWNVQDRHVREDRKEVGVARSRGRGGAGGGAKWPRGRLWG